MELICSSLVLVYCLTREGAKPSFFCSEKKVQNLLKRVSYISKVKTKQAKTQRHDKTPDSIH